MSVLSDGSIQRIIKIENVGKFKFGISLEGLNSLSKKINIVRHGMLITENLKKQLNYGEDLKKASKKLIIICGFQLFFIFYHSEAVNIF